MIIEDKIERDSASHIAYILLEQGMLYGQELEDYIKLSLLNYLEFKNDEHYLAFEDLVLEYIEERKTKIFLEDTLLNTTKQVNSLNAIVTQLGVSRPRLVKYINTNELLNDRYKVFIQDKKAHELRKV